jgi:hypothetical protein
MVIIDFLGKERSTVQTLCSRSHFENTVTPGRMVVDLNPSAVPCLLPDLTPLRREAGFMHMADLTLKCKPVSREEQ